MPTHQDDLDLLLSLQQDRVLETHPGSPSAQSSGYLSENGSQRRKRVPTDMSVFRDAVQDCLDYDPKKSSKKASKSNNLKSSRDSEVEKFSGLRIRNQLVSTTELGNCFADIRFVRLPAIKNLLMGDTLSGCWATVGVLTEMGEPRRSSTGKTFSIWKISGLDENTVSLFLFGDAYEKYSKEKAGTIFALFNCSVRKDNYKSEIGFYLSVYAAGQMLKMGTSVDFGVCKGKGKDGMACTLVINKRSGIYCKYHKPKASDKYSVTRAELKGGTNITKAMQPKKLLSVGELKKALSNACKVTSNAYSQGIRFLTEMTVTGQMCSRSTSKAFSKPHQQMNSSVKRSSSTAGLDLPGLRPSQQSNARRETEQGRASTEKIKEGREKMIELDYISSDEEN